MDQEDERIGFETEATVVIAETNDRPDLARDSRDDGDVCMDNEDVPNVMEPPGKLEMAESTALKRGLSQQDNDLKIERMGGDCNHPTLRHHTRQVSSGRKRFKANDKSKSSRNTRANSNQSSGNEWDRSAASSESSMNSSPSDKTNRSSSGYDGGKSGSNGTSSDSMSVACRGANGSGSGSGSGSDDGYFNNGKSVTFSQMPSNGDSGRVDNAGGRSPTSSSSDCSSDEFPGQVDSKPPTRIGPNRSGKSSSIAGTSGTGTTSDDKAPSSTAPTESFALASDIKYKRSSRLLKPAPYFYYIDRSRDPDEDPITPITPPLYVPSFVAKMHAILIREDLSDIICWMPHGRSWNISDPNEFELRILPIYFNHTKLASFYRQANGWGFRRMLKGPDKGSFYNENFLRGLPHLSKKMKRTGGVKIIDEGKLDTNIAHEPNLWAISEENPLPDFPEVGSLCLLALNAINHCVLEGGPKAKMPVLQGENGFGRRHPPVAIGNARRSEVAGRQGNSNGSSGLESSESSSGKLRVGVVTTVRSRMPNSSSSASSSLTSSAGAAFGNSSSGSNTELNQRSSHINAPEIPNQQIQEELQNNVNQNNDIIQQLALLHRQQQQPNPPANEQAQMMDVIQNNANFSMMSSSLQQQPQQSNQPSFGVFPQQQQQQQQRQEQKQLLAQNADTAGILGQLFASQQQANLNNFAAFSFNNLANQQAAGRSLSDNNIAPIGNLMPQELQQEAVQRNNIPSYIPSVHEVERLLNSLLQTHGIASNNISIHGEQHRENKGVSSTLPSQALRNLIARSILLGAQYGAQQVMNNGSNSSNESANQDDSSNTTSR